MLYFFRNASTRPAVSTSLSRPVKNGWQLAHTATRMLGTVERVYTVAPQVHVIVVSASIMAPATPFFFCATQKHLAGKIV